MNQHPYLRAYMAGIAVPSAFFLIATTAYTLFRLVYHFPVAVKRFIVFPLTVVPNAWGFWKVRWKAEWTVHVGNCIDFKLRKLAFSRMGITSTSIPSGVTPSKSASTSDAQRRLTNSTL